MAEELAYWRKHLTVLGAGARTGGCYEHDPDFYKKMIEGNFPHTLGERPDLREALYILQRAYWAIDSLLDEIADEPPDDC